jgi:hypothetical protein
MTTPSSRYGELPRFELPACLEFLKLKQFPLKTFPAVYEPERPTQDTLYIYGPGYRNTAASFDVDCLQIQVNFTVLYENRGHSANTFTTVDVLEIL